MRSWRPARSLGGIIGLLLTVLSWLCAAGLGYRFVQVLSAGRTAQAFWLGLSTLGLLFLGAVLLYWSVAFFTLRYDLDRNGLTLYWGADREVLPMAAIREVRPWQGGERVRAGGLFWPGYHRGKGHSPTLGKVRFYATTGRSGQLLVRTDGETLVISPREPTRFLEELRIRQNLGVTRPLERVRCSWWIFGWEFWRIPAIWIVGGLALLVNLALIGFLCYQYPSLPPRMPVHFVEIVEEGRVRIVADLIGRSLDLFKLPAFGLVILFGNLGLAALLHRRRRLLVSLLLAVALLAQILFGLGLFFILAH